ncbi:ABC transporter permease [Roseiterribacter gracilis]|uniref:ABC transporter permease n=1 Tax=Roseiterribacter gracilis TaxID=2812848 RepID=A0A8S8XDL8_9PROT|nr:ABC transporter permease [Rhodospirillales bacterium TMPK1]
MKFDKLLVLAAILGVWQMTSLLVGVEVLTPPLGTFAKIGRLFADPDFGGHVWETTRAFALALVLSLAIGLLVGLALGADRLAAEVGEPMLTAFYAIPKVTLYPVILLFFGLGFAAKVAFGALHGIIPVALFTMAGVRNVKPGWLRAARAMRLTKLQIARSVLLPAALPELVAGLRVGTALTLLGTLIGEMFASQRGLGYLLLQAMERNDPATITALALLLTIFATSASALLLALERRLDHARVVA